MSSTNKNEGTYTGPVDHDDGEGGFEALTDGFVKFLGAPWPGEAAIVENDEGVGTVIYTDREKAGGTVYIGGDNGSFSSSLALRWQESFNAGRSTGDIFDELCAEYGVTETWEVDKLTDLVHLDAYAPILGYGPYAKDEEEEPDERRSRRRR